MIKNGKLKVVWLCNFSDNRIKEKLKYSRSYFKLVISIITGRPLPKVRDFGVWISNAIREFEKFDDIDLTIVFPYWGIKGRIQSFDIHGIHYVCYKTEDDNIIDYYRIHRKGIVKKDWNKNRAIIAGVINQLKPDIVHVIGAENPYYSIAALDIPSDVPCVTSLQTLVSSPDFCANYPISKKQYEFRSELEKQIIKRSDYIATRVDSFISYIKNNIKPDAVFLQMVLAVGVDINIEYNEKQYDFVYFAVDINKASDDAIEAFAIALRKVPNLTLNISGSYDEKYKAALDERIKELGIKEKVIFTGPQPTHDDVIRQIKRSRFALLPLKVDLISSTIREAMACGLPVVSTITPATPSLNLERESLLLSMKGDYEAMADNMLRLVKDDVFSEMIRRNAVQTVSERFSNEAFMKNWRKAYYQIIENFHSNTPFSADILMP